MTEHIETLIESEREQLNRYASLCKLTKETIYVRDFDELLRKISEETAKFFNATGCVIRLLEDGMLKVKASYGFPDEMRDLTVNIGEGVAGRAVAEGRTIIATGPEEFGIIVPGMDVKTAVCTPLKIGEQIIGTFGLYDKRATDGSIIAFSEADMKTLEDFASIAAIVIDKSILYENAVRKEREAIKSKEQIEELRDYLQGLIDNSADSIITTDLEGRVTSWNKGAENNCGYTKEEAIGRFLPSVPDFLRDVEMGYIERVKRGETIKGLETIRKTKDGRIIDISLTLSPIKDASGNITGVSGIARDITERKKAEREIMSKNATLSRLYFISSAMRGTLELDKLLRMVLTAVTMGDGLGFNRAMLFLIDEDRNVIKGAMGVGPASHEEAWEIWSRLSIERKDIHTIMQEIDRGPLRKDSFMDRLCCGIEIPLDADTILTRTIKEKRVFNVTDVYSEPLSDPVLIQQLGTMAYAVVPLISRDKPIGVLWVDNLYSRRAITDQDLEFLSGFTSHIASAIENARLFEKVAEAEQELKNIFESISDLVYFNSSDYTIKKVNKAVTDKLGRPADEIVGKKCYEVFHGMSEPWKRCPHHKTLFTKKSIIEEIEDPHLGGTFLVSSSPIFDKSGEILGTVHIVRDVSELKRLREKVISAERMAALGEMAAKVAHEIRNPLLSIGGFARRLESRLTGELNEHAKIIVEEVTRLEGILNDTLSFIRTARLDRRIEDISEVIDNVIQLLQPVLHDKGNVITKEISEPIRVLIDHNRIKEAILNIVNNANQATENGMIVIRAYKTVTLSEPDLLGYRAESKEAVIEIEDNGCGIKEEDIGRIFDPFFTTRASGTGLGLSITKRIIEEHRGKIEVESVWGRGTKFKIYMPLEEE